MSLRNLCAVSLAFSSLIGSAAAASVVTRVQVAPRLGAEVYREGTVSNRSLAGAARTRWHYLSTPEGPAPTDGWAAVVFVHGGSGDEGPDSAAARDTLEVPQLRKLREEYVVLSASYRRSTPGCEELLDVLEASAWLAGQAFVDKERIVLIGSSHGALISLLALATVAEGDLAFAGVDGLSFPFSYRALVVTNPGTDFHALKAELEARPLRRAFMLKLFPALIGDVLKMDRVFGQELNLADRAGWRSVTPRYRYDDDGLRRALADTPILIMHGVNDHIVPPDHARWLAGALGLQPAGEGDPRRVVYRGVNPWLSRAERLDCRPRWIYVEFTRAEHAFLEGKTEIPAGAYAFDLIQRFLDAHYVR